MKKSEAERIVRQIRRKIVDVDLVERVYTLMSFLYIVENAHMSGVKLFYGYDFESDRERVLYNVASKILACGYFPKWANRSMNSHFPLESRYEAILAYISSCEFDVDNIPQSVLDKISKIMK
ncbi:hypothetical protein P5704_024480 (plasmid) [Pseudomonas sp. FeN3W]|nr:hypothetical protein P5704_024480 [Pseudomonas sp. FeN3W]